MSSSICRVCGAMGMCLVLVAGTLPCGSDANAADLAVYGDGLAAGWENWSWNTTTGFANTSPVHSGTRSLAVTYTGAWAGLYLATNTPESIGSHDTLQFWILGGARAVRQCKSCWRTAPTRFLRITLWRSLPVRAHGPR